MEKALKKNAIAFLAIAVLLSFVSTARAETAITWKNVIGATVSNGTLTRQAGGAWNAGASSVEEIAAGDGYVQFSTGETSKSKMAGLSRGDDNQGNGDIDYAVYLRSDGY